MTNFQHDKASTTPRINLHVNITPSKQQKIPADMERTMAAMPPGLLTQLKKHEPQLLEWLKKDPKHPYLLVADPVKALQQAVPAMEVQWIQSLQEFRQSQQTNQAKLPVVDLNKFTVGIKKD